MIRNNNQNGRRRGRGGARPPQAGGGPSGNYGNNNGGGSRIDVRQRGNATQLLEKYKAMARDATQNGDRVQAEFYMQYADHYYRVLNEFRARDPQPAPRQNYDEDDGFDNMGGVGQNYAPPQPGSYADDGDDEEGDDEAPRREAPVQQQADRQNYDRQNGERQNYNRNASGNGNGASQPQQRAYNGQQRDGQASRDGQQQRDGGQRENSQQRDGQPQRENGQQREAQPRENGQQRDGYQRDNQQRDGAQRPNGNRDAEPRAPRDAEPRAPRDAEPRAARDDTRTDALRDTRQDDARPAERVREPYRRVAEPEPMIAGLPGPATMAAEAAPAPAPVIDTVPEAQAEPVRRPRGRPRKVVVVAEDAADA